jgi:acetolactate synthase regulatory subunit
MSAVTCFAVQAAPSPNVLSRVFDLLARHGVVPARCHTHVEPEAGLVIDLQLADLDARLAEKLHLGLRRLVDVDDVLVAAKHPAG